MGEDIINKEADVTKKAAADGLHRPPMPEIIKTKIDGIFVTNQKKGSWGFISRDHEGSASWLALDQ